MHGSHNQCIKVDLFPGSKSWKDMERGICLPQKALKDLNLGSRDPNKEVM